MSEKLSASDNPANREHLCAKQVVHEKWGKGDCIPTMHAEATEDGHVAWYDVMFEHGIETKVAVDSDGVAQGGVFMNSIQEMLLRVCKMCMPPNKPAYTIKDECLGTFALDREREEVIKLFTEVKNINFKLADKIINNYEKFEPVMLNINQYQSLMLSKIGQLCGHIDNYNDKISNSNLEEFTTTRVKGLIEIYNNMNSYLNDVTSKVL